MKTTSTMLAFFVASPESGKTLAGLSPLFGLDPANGGDGTVVALRADLRRVPVSMKKTIELDPQVPRLRITSTIENTSVQRLPYSWGFHPAFGQDLLKGGCRLYLPADDVRIHGERFSARQRWEPATRQKLESVGSTSFLNLRDRDERGGDAGLDGGRERRAAGGRAWCGRGGWLGHARHAGETAGRQW